VERDADGRGPAFMASAFSYDAERDIYLCPAGEKLTHHAIYNDKNGVRRHVYKQPRSAWRTCTYRDQCASKKPAAGWRRSIARLEEPSATTAFKAKMKTEEAKQIYKQRSQIAEFKRESLQTDHEKTRFRQSVRSACPRNSRKQMPLSHYASAGQEFVLCPHFPTQAVSHFLGPLGLERVDRWGVYPSLRPAAESPFSDLIQKPIRLEGLRTSVKCLLEKPCNSHLVFRLCFCLRLSMSRVSHQPQLFWLTGCGKVP
jgi:hypothetical protein